MQISSRFTIAVHIFACLETFQGKIKITSDFLAGSVNTNPVIIRKILLQLRNAGLLNVARGTGGITLAKSPEQITLLDIYNAVESVENGTLFHFHEAPNSLCPVGRNIHKILDEKLERVQSAMEKELQSISLAEIQKDTNRIITEEQGKK